jgi:pSer/pThr/pTyr-binding forkhead associated (FHA) protein
LFFKTIDAFLEDLNSRNGSFIGSSPLELSRVAKGTKASISFGDYIRFGHSQKLFRYLEKIPPSPLPIVEQPSLEEEDELQVLPTEQGVYLSSIVCTKCYLNCGIWFDTCYTFIHIYIYVCIYIRTSKLDCSRV